MNWNAIGAIGQIMGSLATFVTVGYLAVDVHENEIEARRAIAQNGQERTIEYLRTLATNERLVAIHGKVNNAFGTEPFPFFKAAQEQAGLTGDEAYSLYAEQLGRWNNIAQSVHYMDELLPEDRAHFDRTTRLTLLEPSFRFWYQIAKPTLSPDAVSYIDNLLRQPN